MQQPKMLAIVVLVLLSGVQGATESRTHSDLEELLGNPITAVQGTLVDRAVKAKSLQRADLESTALGKGLPYYPYGTAAGPPAPQLPRSSPPNPSAPHGSYRAAVVELAPTVEKNWQSLKDSEVRELKLQNVQRLATFAAEAKQRGAQILVSPENGITGDYDFTRASVQPFLEELPSNVVNPVGFNPCDEAASLTLAPAIAQAACIAKELAIVLVINALTRVTCIQNQDGCPLDGMRIHNTAIAFAETGAILALYNKRHLWSKELLWVNPGDTSMVEGQMFTTSFGVKFGMFICFDILYHAQDGGPDALDIVFPTDWVNKPIGMHLKEGLASNAHTAQRMWSFIHHKNLLAANYGGLGSYSSGSGIWHAGEALQKYFNPTKMPRSRLLVADVPVISLARWASLQKVGSELGGMVWNSIGALNGDSFTGNSVVRSGIPAHGAAAGAA